MLKFGGNVCFAVDFNRQHAFPGSMDWRGPGPSGEGQLMDWRGPGPSGEGQLMDWRGPGPSGDGQLAEIGCLSRVAARLNACLFALKACVWHCSDRMAEWSERSGIGPWVWLVKVRRPLG